MKTTYFTFAVMLLSVLASCTVEAPDASLTITTDKKEYKVGEPVTFHIKGDADNIVFYSGEKGHEYELKDRLYADNNLMLDMVTYTDYLDRVQDNLQCLVSTDFEGIYDVEHLQSATWTDISEKIGFATTTGHNTPSNTINLKPYASDDNDAIVYIAFRYYDKDNVAEKNRWVIRSINVEKISPEGTETQVGNMKTMGWHAVTVSGNPVWTITTSQLLAAGKTTTNNKDQWVISKGFKIREAEPSTGVALKNISTSQREYEYTFTEPGTYDVVFASSSVWYNSSDRSLATIHITVTE
jgi:hypothetical protein